MRYCTLDHIVFDEPVSNSEWRRWVETKRFFDGRFEVWQRGPILERWQPLAANNGVKLSLDPLLHVREEHHGQQECAYTRRRLGSGVLGFHHQHERRRMQLTDSVPATEKEA
jgi:hypothetical protein